MIGKVDLESNKIIDYLDPIWLDIIYEDSFIASDPIRLFNRDSNSTIWVSSSLIDENGVCKMRVLPRELNGGRYFTLMPRINLLEGIIYLINGNSCYKYNIKYNG